MNLRRPLAVVLYDIICHSAYNIVTSQWVAEDVVQTAIEKLIPKINLLRGLTKKKQINYVISTVKNAAYSSVRKSKQTEGLIQFSIDDGTECAWCYRAATAKQRKVSQIILNFLAMAILHPNIANSSAKVKDGSSFD